MSCKHAYIMSCDTLTDQCKLLSEKYGGHQQCSINGGYAHEPYDYECPLGIKSHRPKREVKVQDTSEDIRYSIDRMLSEEPLLLDGMMTNTHVTDYDSLYTWVLGRYKELITIQDRLEREERTDDELYEHCASGAGILREVIVNMRQIRKGN